MSFWGAEEPSNNLVERPGPERPAAHEERSTADATTSMAAFDYQSPMMLLLRYQAMAASAS